MSHGGTIWAGSPTPGSGRAPVYARTSVTRVDPVYVAEVTGAVIVSDRATWAAWAASRLDDHDPLHVCALLNPGFALGSVTPFRGVSALSGSTTLHLLNGELTSMPTPVDTVTGSRGALGAGAAAGRSAGSAGAGPAGGGTAGGGLAGGGRSRPSITLRRPAGSRRTGRADGGKSGGTVSVGLAGLGLAADEPDEPDVPDVPDAPDKEADETAPVAPQLTRAGRIQRVRRGSRSTLRVRQTVCRIRRVWRA